MKRILSILFIAALLLTCMATAAFAAAPAITVSEEIAQTGEEVTVEVKLIGNTGFKAYGMILTYNTKELNLVSITKGELSTEGNFTKNMTTAKVGYSNSEVVSGDGVLFTATFEVLAGEGEYTVGVNVDAIGLSNSDTMDVSVTAGSVTVPHVCAPVAQPRTPATCVADGVKAHDKCACGKLYIDGVEVSADELVILATGHINTEVKDAVSATCTKDGYTGNTYCKDCGEKIKSGEVINAAGHGENEVENAVSATCTKEGYTGDTYCKDCGEKIKSGEVITATGHGETEVKNAVSATCTKDGYTGDTYCKDCGEKIKSGEVIKAEGHPNTEVKGKVEATCTKDGYTGDTYCKDCGEKIKSGEVIKATGHTATLVGKADADCEKDGYTGDEKCSVCGETLKKGEKIPATGHDYGEDGVCKNCGHVAPETGDASVVFPWILAIAVCIGAAYVTLRRRSNA